MQEKHHRLQILKFNFYGLLKNLRFFEPFMIIYFIQGGLDLFLVGLLFSIREIVIYIFEIPSGVIADRYGKKTELIFCFMFYILSFFLFFIANGFLLYAFAMFFFALGEAFRSGTHKAMIMTYIDHHDLKASKTKIYGMTRSYSLIGSMIASIVSIFLVLWLPEIRYLFLVAILPYVIDLMMVLTYPNYLNEKRDSVFTMKAFLKNNFQSIGYSFKTKDVRKAIFNSGSYQAVFKSIKDYVQPILLAATGTLIVFSQFSEEQNTKIYIGIIYALIYFLSAFASRNAYRFNKYGEPKTLIRYMWFATGLALFILSYQLNNMVIVFLAFVVIYMIMNIRKPIMIELIGDVTDEDKRATVLSVEAQTASILIAIFAPL
ncbi:MAG: MFS transporter, partial [Candidatus Moranbacteria bacterium]|nr:MFS transporter [Candidatus Moranbacteria bacterium]